MKIKSIIQNMLYQLIEEFAKSLTKINYERNKDLNKILRFECDFMEAIKIGGLK